MCSRAPLQGSAYSGVLEEEAAHGDTATTLVCVLVTPTAFEPHHQTWLNFDPTETLNLSCNM